MSLLNAIRLLTHYCVLSSLLLIATSLAQASEVANPEEAWLAEVSQNKANPVEARVDATLALGNHTGANALIAIARASRDPHSKLRGAAIRAIDSWSEVARWDVISPLLNDPNIDVQGLAIRKLLPLRDELNQQQKAYFDAQIDTYLSHESVSDSYVAAEVLIALNRFEQAQEILDAFPIKSEQGMLLQSEIYLKKEGNNKAIAYLDSLIEQKPDSPSLHFRSGLINAQQGNYDIAEIAFRRANELAPDTPRYLQGLATVLYQSEPSEAATLFNDLYALSPSPEYLFASCQSLINAHQEATDCIDKLSKVAPQNIVTQLKQQILDSNQ